MEFRIAHGPAAPRNDLQFVKAGTLRVTPQAVEFSGKWRKVMPGKASILPYLMLLPLMAAISTDLWIPWVWPGAGESISGISRTILLLIYAVIMLLQTTPLPKKITADRGALREIARSSREVTFLLRNVKGRERHALFNTDTEEEAAAIETALRDGGTGQAFTITYGPAAARPIMPVPGQIVIGPENVHLNGRIPRDPYPNRRVMWPVVAIFTAYMLVMGFTLVILVFTTSPPATTKAIYFTSSFILFILLFFGTMVYMARRIRQADVSKMAISEIRQQGQEVSFRAPLEGNHGVSGVTTVLQAGNPEQAVAIAQALAARTEGSTPYTVNYGSKRNVNPFNLVGNGRLRVDQDAVRITGRPARLALSAGIGLLALIFVPFIIVYVLAWLVVHDMILAMLISMPTSLISIIVTSWPSRVTILRQAITGVERDGRQLTLRAQIAGQEEQAVFHTHTEEEAGAVSEALSG